jgi:hypothetical protein
MKITFKRTNQKYVVTVDGYPTIFTSSKEAWGFIINLRNKEHLVDEKISLLYDFCVLKTRKDNPDKQEQAVRQMLTACEGESAMQHLVHDILVGNCTLKQMLQRKGVI